VGGDGESVLVTMEGRGCTLEAQYMTWKASIKESVQAGASQNESTRTKTVETGSNGQESREKQKKKK